MASIIFNRNYYSPFADAENIKILIRDFVIKKSLHSAFRNNQWKISAFSSSVIQRIMTDGHGSLLVKGKGNIWFDRLNQYKIIQ